MNNMPTVYSNRWVSPGRRTMSESPHPLDRFWLPDREKPAVQEKRMGLRKNPGKIAQIVDREDDL